MHWQLKPSLVQRSVCMWLSDDIMSDTSTVIFLHTHTHTQTYTKSCCSVITNEEVKPPGFLLTALWSSFNVRRVRHHEILGSEKIRRPPFYSTYYTKIKPASSWTLRKNVNPVMEKRNMVPDINLSGPLFCQILVSWTLPFGLDFKLLSWVFHSCECQRRRGDAQSTSFLKTIKNNFTSQGWRVQLKFSMCAHVCT